MTRGCCTQSGPCGDLHDLMRRTNPMRYDGRILWGNTRLASCLYCGSDLPDVVVNAWDWKPYGAPRPLMVPEPEWSETNDTDD